MYKNVLHEIFENFLKTERIHSDILRLFFFFFFFFFFVFLFRHRGARWRSGRASDSESRGPGFDPHRRHRGVSFKPRLHIHDLWLRCRYDSPRFVKSWCTVLIRSRTVANRGEF